jgi:hypothetical protein
MFRCPISNGSCRNTLREGGRPGERRPGSEARPGNRPGMGLVLPLLLLLVHGVGGCQAQKGGKTQPGAAGQEPNQVAWDETQRRAFELALKLAREQLYQQLRQVRVSQKEKLADLVRRLVVSSEELRKLAATARIRRVVWSDDDRCRVEIGLSLLSVADAMDRWDPQGHCAPHSQILKLNPSPVLVFVGESTPPGQ